MTSAGLASLEPGKAAVPHPLPRLHKRSALANSSASPSSHKAIPSLSCSFKDNHSVCEFGTRQQSECSQVQGTSSQGEYPQESLWSVPMEVSCLFQVGQSINYEDVDPLMRVTDPLETAPSNRPALAFQPCENPPWQIPASTHSSRRGTASLGPGRLPGKR